MADEDPEVKEDSFYSSDSVCKQESVFTPRQLQGLIDMRKTQVFKESPRSINKTTISVKTAESSRFQVMQLKHLYTPSLRGECHKVLDLDRLETKRMGSGGRSVSKEKDWLAHTLPFLSPIHTGKLMKTTIRRPSLHQPYSLNTETPFLTPEVVKSMQNQLHSKIQRRTEVLN